MRFLWFSDTHVSDTAPVMRTETYTDDIFEKIAEVSSLCVEHEVDYALFGGDWFNNKLAARVSHNLVNRSLRALDAFPCPVIFIVGSHDVPYGRLDLLYKRPIGTLLRHPNVKYLDSALELVENNIAVRLYPVSDSYNNTTEEVVSELTRMRYEADTVKADGVQYYDVALLHQPVVKEGSFPFPVVQSADLVGLADAILYGHMHNYEGTWEMRLPGGPPTTFVNMGAVSRGSLDEKTLSRVPTVFMFDVLEIAPDHTLGMAYNEIPLKSAKPAEEVFRFAEKQEQVNREADIEALLTSVKETGFTAFSSQTAIDKIRGMSYTPREDATPEDTKYAIAHFDAVKTVAVEILEELGG